MVAGLELRIDPLTNLPTQIRPPLPSQVLRGLFFDVELATIQRVAGVPEALALGVAALMIAGTGWRRRLWLATLALRGLGLLRLWALSILRLW
jgi:hypothetical protein